MKSAKIRDSNNSRQNIYTPLLDQTLDAKHTDDADTSELENKIDKLVYELYNL